MTARTSLVAVAMSILAASTVQAGFFIETEPVFFQMRQSDTAFAIELDSNSSAIGGVVKRLDPSSSSGVRLSLGFTWTGNWDFTLRNTSLDADDSNTATGLNNVSPLLTHPSDLTLASSATGRLDQSYDVITLEIGRTFGTPAGHRARFFGGPNLVSFDQTINLVYDNFGDPWTVDVDQGIDATGIRLGGEGHLALGKGGVTLFARGAIGAYTASYDVSLLEIDRLPPEDTIVDIAEDVDGTSSSIEAALGINWTRDRDKWDFGMQLGYEISNYTDFINVRDYIDDTHAGKSVTRDDDLGVEGLYFRLSFAF